MIFNTERALAVAAAIRNAPPASFDMRYYYDIHVVGVAPTEPIVTGGLGPCGTVGCIAGWTVSLFHDELDETDNPVIVACDWEDLAADLLGLDDDQAHVLFHGHWFVGGLGDITQADAADELEYLVAHYERHGTVDL